MRKKSRKYIVKSIIVHFLLAIFLLFFLFPIIWMLISSLQPQENLMREVYHFSTDNIFINYIELFENAKFQRALQNTILISAISTIMTIAFSGCAAYVFSRFNFRFKNLSMYGVYSIQMGPAVSFLIPLFFIFRQLRLIDNIWALILAITTFTIPMSMWIMYGFINSIPKEIEESALIDGCNRLQTFLLIIVPLAKPGMISACIVTFIAVWGEMLLALPLTLTKATPLTVFASSFSGIYTTNFGGAAAVSIISTLPVVIIVFVFQKYLLRGLAEGAVKG
ncbi:MAG: carbohydrate ABC transporter permease [Flexilinea sp.]